MSQLPVHPLSPEDQKKIMGQLYLLMGKQVQSYHKHRHMGNNSSVPMELAQELMESVEYTLNQAGGMFAHSNAEDALRQGQELLENKLSKAKSTLKLVSGTAPHWQTECRWDALRCLQHYLEHYDHLHLAHKGPEDLFYPILISPPEGIRGIDSCLFYLNILWIENQIMAGVPEKALELFWNRLPTATLNQCEHLLINGMGKALLNTGLDPLTFDPEEHMLLLIAMARATDETLKTAAVRLCRWLNLKDQHARDYVQAVVPLLTLWTGSNIPDNFENLFL